MTRIALANPEVRQHLRFTGVTWNDYERTLAEVGSRPLRVTFLDGEMEIMSPLPKHETAKKAIGRLVEALTEELDIPAKSFGSTTFRGQMETAGTEPDECYYFRNIERVAGMERFDPTIHPAPDLAIEIDILNPSIPREPVYARLGVAEVWRYSGDRLAIRTLGVGKTYADASSSSIFPFLPIPAFAPFIGRMIAENETRVLRDFRHWVRALSF